ncbi:MAG: NTP transferase domain-containing protein [Candidatus Bathyarchaeia archaeon]
MSIKRFGRNKLLEKIDGSTIIERVVKSALSSKTDEVIVVLGFETHKVLNILKKFNCRFVFNEEFYSGQSSSVKVGVKAVIEYAEAVIILPENMALITSKPINMIINEYYESRSPIIG